MSKPIVIMFAFLYGAAVVLGNQPSSGAELTVGAGPTAGTKPATAPLSLVSVCDLGAVGDGQTDDAPAIQRAVDAGRGDLFFRRGVYRLTRPIVVDLDKVGPTSFRSDGTARLLMAGPGPAIRFVGTHNGTADPATIQPKVWQRQRMPTVDGLEIVGAHAAACGIEAAGTMQLTVTRCNIRECLHGIHLINLNRNVIVAECHLYHNRGVGLYLEDADLHQINVTGSHISYNAGGGVVSRSGNVRNIQISGCDIESNMTPEAPPTANVLIDCTDKAAGTAEVAVTGCTIQHNSKSPGSANIRFLGADRGGRPWGHLTATSNIFSDTHCNLDLQNVRGAVIVGNTFGKAEEYDLRAVACTNLVVGPNVLGRNPAYNAAEKNAQGGVLFQGCRNITITGLHLVEVCGLPAGMVLEDCARSNVTGCTILDCEQAGLLLKNVTDSRVSACLIRNDRKSAGDWTALKVEGGSGNAIADPE